MNKKEIVKIIKDNIRWSPYGSTNYTMIDSFEKIAELILEQTNELKENNCDDGNNPDSTCYGCVQAGLCS